MKKVKFTTMIDETILENIKIMAVKEKRSVSDILNELIMQYLREKGEA